MPWKYWKNKEKPAFFIAKVQVFLHTIFSRKYNYKKEEIMYLNYVVDIPKIKGKISFRNKGKARYDFFLHSICPEILAFDSLQPDDMHYLT